MALFATLISAGGSVSHAQEPLLLDQWYVIRFDGKPVGYEHVTVGSESESDRSLLQCLQKTQLQLKRLGQDLTVEATLSTTQTTDGVLHSFDLLRVDGSGHRTERRGQFDSAKRVFHVEERVNATRRQRDIRVSGTVYSPLLTTWLPAAMGDSTRRLSPSVFFPESSAVATITANRRQDRRIRVEGNTTVNTRQILFHPQLDPARSTILFAAPTGEVVRQEKLILGSKLTLEAADAETALTAASGKSLNLDVTALIPIDRLLPQAGIRRSLVLDLTTKHGVIGKIPNSEFQTVERRSESSVRITLRNPVIPRRGITPASRLAPPPQTATRWMPLDDPILQRMAAAGAAGHTDPGEICRRLETYVHSKMQRSPFSTTMLPADEVARSLRGDCSEHAILLAALFRVRSIPSRVVSGLVHTQKLYGFTGHVWAEAWINGKWIPFDSTLSDESHRATHVKLAHSDMPDSLTSSIPLFLPILDLTGRASIHMVAAQ